MTFPHYLPVLIMIGAAAAFGIGSMIATHLIGPKKKTPVKQMTYESGKDPVGDARLRFNVRFYLIAMIFVVFDIEVVFFYPWAAIYREQISQGLLILVEMLVFVGILLVGYVVAWKKGALEWE